MAARISNQNLFTAKQYHGFTLVELLVVISIIAVLLAVLMPSLQNAREQGRSVVCMSNVKQWNAIFMMYTNDYKGKFWEDGWQLDPATKTYKQGMWMWKLGGYYQDCEKFRHCPSATKYTTVGVGGTFNAWGGPDNVKYMKDAGFIDPDGKGRTLSGSYGANLWINSGAGWGGMPARQWGCIPNKNASNIPMVGDSTWFGVHPTDTWDVTNSALRGMRGKVPPTSDYFKDRADFEIMMARVCIPRHSKRYVNWGFMDFSARRIALPELWTLKWHREYVPNPNVTIPWLR
jgi:prepilin-type N-terminal cleavage/methylation domain-containing protein